MIQAELFESKQSLPIIYRYENFNIHKKINYKSSNMFKYGSQHKTTIDVCYNEPVYNRYGCNRTGLDYSLNPQQP